MQPEGINKVFGIGFHKTGTKTLRKSLEILGYNVCGYQPGLINHLRKDNWEPVLDMVQNFEAFEDNPWPLLYERLDQEFPNSRFILTIRDNERWLRSAVNQLGTVPRKTEKWIYGQSFPGGYEEIYMERYIRHNREVIEYFKDRPNDLLIVNWEEGSDWKPLCSFLNQKIPDAEFPHANKGNYSQFRQVLRKTTIFLVRMKRKILSPCL